MAFAYRSWSYIASTGLNSPEPQGTRLSLLFISGLGFHPLAKRKSDEKQWRCMFFTVGKETKTGRELHVGFVPDKITSSPTYPCSFTFPKQMISLLAFFFYIFRKKVLYVQGNRIFGGERLAKRVSALNTGESLTMM
jgi:hypothetical protein